MKRGMQRSVGFCVRLLLMASAMGMSFAPCAVAQETTVPPVSRSQSVPESSQEPQKASGVVPPGVKLVPQMPGPGAPRPFDFPKAATKMLPNGLRLFVVTDHSEPAIAARLVILSAGSIKDPAGMPGVAEMEASLLTQGTEKRSARDIADAIDFIGGSLNATAGRDVTTVTLDIVKKDLAVGMDLMSDVVLHPSFRGEELDRQRQQLLSNLQVQYSDPDYLATLVFSHAIVWRVAVWSTARGHAGDCAEISARRFREISRCELRAQPVAAGVRRRHHAGTGIRSGREIFWQLAKTGHEYIRAGNAQRPGGHARMAG